MILNNSSSNLTSITIQWDAVECIDQNSDITGYMVMFDGRMMNVTSEARQFTASGLFPNTMYTFQVAAVSMSDTGPYSNITASTTLPQSISCIVQSGKVNNCILYNCRCWFHFEW